MFDFQYELRQAIDSLLVLGLTPFQQASFSYADAHLDSSQLASKIVSAADEWVKYVRNRVGVDRLTKFDSFIRKDHQVLTTLNVKALVKLATQASSSL